MIKELKGVILILALVALVWILNSYGCLKKHDHGKPEVPVVDQSVEISRWRDAYNREHLLVTSAEAKITQKDKIIDSLKMVASAAGIKNRNIVRGSVIRTHTTDTVKIPVLHEIMAFNDSNGIRIPLTWSDSFTRLSGALICHTDSGIVYIDSLELMYKVKNNLTVVYGEKRLKWWKKKVPVVAIVSDNPNSTNNVVDVVIKKKKWYQTGLVKVGAGAGALGFLLLLL